MKSESAFELERAPWPALILESTGAISSANAAARLCLAGSLDAELTSAEPLWAPENKQSFAQFLGSLDSTDPSGLIKLRGPEGAMLPFEARICPVEQSGNTAYLVQLFPSSGSAGIGTETERGPAGMEEGKRESNGGSEAALAQKQKLECALQLTRTVALDFNNALTSILGHASLILSRMDASHSWRGSLIEIEKSAEKAAEVAADLAAFSRQEKNPRAHVTGSLNDLVRRTVELFQGGASRSVNWVMELEPKLFSATFEEAKMQQAFVKILDNAVQALGVNGRVTVRTRNQEVLESVRDENVRLAPGHYVCVEVEDNGCGIRPEVLPRIFEPFFTTKNDPQHRGLGLAWVYGIVTNHGGSVAVSSQPSQGTAIRVYLPAQKKFVRDSLIPAGELNGTQTVLMVDDEELLLTMGEMVLSSFGYRVLTASSGTQALELFSRERDRIDLVITDMVMPKMSGRELIEQLRLLSPNVKVVCSSGYVRAVHPDEEDLYLQKPFTSLDLLRKVKQALSSHEAT